MPQGSENTATRPVGAWSKDWPWGLEEAHVGQEVSALKSAGAIQSGRGGARGGGGWGSEGVLREAGKRRAGTAMQRSWKRGSHGLG